VGVVVPGAGDLVLAPQFARFVAALAGPCGAPRDLRPVDAATRAALAGGGPLAAARAVGGEAARRSPLAPWLLGAAGLALVAELLVRRRGPGVAA
jgi:hypothetical protein